MSRTRVRRRRAALALIGVGLAGAMAGPATRAIGLTEDPTRSTTELAGRAHVVRDGDTIWEIAERAVGREGDPRPVVDAIIEANDLLGARVLPGQRILVPDA